MKKIKQLSSVLKRHFFWISDTNSQLNALVWQDALMLITQRFEEFDTFHMAVTMRFKAIAKLKKIVISIPNEHHETQRLYLYIDLKLNLFLLQNSICNKTLYVKESPKLCLKSRLHPKSYMDCLWYEFLWKCRTSHFILSLTAHHSIRRSSCCHGAVRLTTVRFYTVSVAQGLVLEVCGCVWRKLH